MADCALLAIRPSMIGVRAIQIPFPHNPREHGTLQAGSQLETVQLYILAVFTSARDFFRKIWNPVRQDGIQISSLTELLGFLIQGQLGEPIGSPSYLLHSVVPAPAPAPEQYYQMNSYTTTRRKDNCQYREAPIINAH